MSQSVSVTVNGSPAPSGGGGNNTGTISILFSATPNIINPGESSNLAWNATGANTCVASGGISGNVTTSGSQRVTPVQTTSYAITCSNSSQSRTETQTVVVRVNTAPPAPPPAASIIVTCVATPSSARVDEFVTFAAGSTGGTGIIGYQWTGDVIGEGISRKVKFATVGKKTSTVTATDANGKTDKATCGVNITSAVVSTSPPPPPPATTTVVDNKIEADYDQICLAKGYIKQTATVAESEPEEEETNDQAATSTKNRSFLAALFFGGGSLSGGMRFFLMIILILIAVFTTMLMMIRRQRRKLEDFEPSSSPMPPLPTIKPMK